jgi:DNA-binding CsgD family transcriptional regulator
VVEGLTFGQNWAMCLIMQERFAEAEALLEKLLPVARKLAVDLAVAIITVLLANLRWRQGRWREAYLHSTLYALSPSLPAISTAWGSAAAASMAAGLGKIGATERFAERAFANIPDGEVPLVRAWANAALGHLHLSQGQPAIALVHLRQTAESVAAMELGQPLFFLWWGDYIEALLGVGERQEAEQILTQLEQRNELLNLRWIEGICERTWGSLASSAETADTHFSQSVRALSECPYPFEVARTKLQWVRHRLRNSARKLPANEALLTEPLLKEPLHTEALLHEAIAEFRRLEATVWEASAQSLHRAGSAALNPAGDSDQRLEDLLSEAELRVALVVAAGRSNREVAVDLYLSVRTVEFHLSAIFRKLALKNRNALINLIQKG